MATAHEKPLAEAIRAADRLHSDRTMSAETAIESLEELREHIDILIESLHCDECDGCDES